MSAVSAHESWAALMGSGGARTGSRARWCGRDLPAPTRLAVAGELNLSSTLGLARRRMAVTPVEVVVIRTRRHVHIAVRDYMSQPARLVGPAGEAEPGAVAC